MEELLALGLKALPFIIAGALGFGAAESYEHKAPWGLAHQRDRIQASIPGLTKAAQDKGAKDQWAVDKPAFDGWGKALTECRSGDHATRDATAATQSRADATASLQASAAYRLGRASCSTGGTHAVNILPTGIIPGGSGPAGGVRDDGDDFARLIGDGAFTTPAPAAVPGRGGGGHP